MLPRVMNNGNPYALDLHVLNGMDELSHGRMPERLPRSLSPSSGPERVMPNGGRREPLDKAAQAGNNPLAVRRDQ